MSNKYETVKTGRSNHQIKLDPNYSASQTKLNQASSTLDATVNLNLTI